MIVIVSLALLFGVLKFVGPELALHSITLRGRSGLGLITLNLKPFPGPATRFKHVLRVF